MLHNFEHVKKLFPWTCSTIVYVNRGKRMCVVGITKMLECTASVPRLDVWFDIKSTHFDTCWAHDLTLCTKALSFCLVNSFSTTLSFSNIKLHQQRWLCYHWHWQWKWCWVRNIPAISVQQDPWHQAEGERLKVQEVQVQVQEAIERHC